MRKVLKKVGILTAIFVVSVLIMEVFASKSGEDRTERMSEATLPTVSMYANGQKINTLFGYTKQMELVYMRDTITPLSSNMVLPIAINTYGAKISEICYRVRNIDGSRLIEDTKVDKFTEDGKTIKADLKLQNLLEEGEEYQVIFKLTADGRDVYYYTRLILTGETHSKECINFCVDFHNKTFNIEKKKDLAIYMESDHTMKNDNLQFVTIKSSMKQLYFAEFKGQPITDIRVNCKEIKNEYSVITIEYSIGAVGENGESEYYNVTEYYRVRWGEKRMYLLNFERTMNQIFREDGNNFGKNSIRLGIVDPEKIGYASNENGTIIGFVQEGDLWEYSTINNSLSCVWSYRGYEQLDERENYGEHAIRVIQVDETGSMDFIIYGYANRGPHEGEVGISVYHYDSIANASEEILYIPFTRSYGMIEQIVGNVLFVNDSNHFYIKCENNIYDVDLTTKNFDVLSSGAGEQWYAVSNDSKRLAFIEGDGVNEGKALRFMDLETGKSFTIKAGANELIRPLGFIEHDLIYGIAKEDDLTEGISTAVHFPMYAVYIMGDDNKVKKEYKKDNVYIVGITTEDYTIKLDREEKVDDRYVSIAKDSIVDMKGDATGIVSLTAIYSEVKQQIVIIKTTVDIKDKDPSLLSAKLIENDNINKIDLEKQGNIKYYYVYAKGNITAISTSVADCVLKAASAAGVVIGEDGRYVWQQAKSGYMDRLTGMRVDSETVGTGFNERCVTVMLQHEGITLSVGELLSSGRSVKKVLDDALKDANVIDLTGASVDQMLYYISNNTPVYALIDGDKPVVFCGYTNRDILYYDPEYNVAKLMRIDDMREQCESAGNVFLTYLRK